MEHSVAGIVFLMSTIMRSEIGSSEIMHVLCNFILHKRPEPIEIEKNKAKFQLLNECRVQILVGISHTLNSWLFHPYASRVNYENIFTVKVSNSTKFLLYISTSNTFIISGYSVHRFPGNVLHGSSSSLHLRGTTPHFYRTNDLSEMITIPRVVESSDFRPGSSVYIVALILIHVILYHKVYICL